MVKPFVVIHATDRLVDGGTGVNGNIGKRVRASTGVVWGMDGCCVVWLVGFTPSSAQGRPVLDGRVAQVVRARS
jgi:hypothetical protein